MNLTSLEQLSDQRIIEIQKLKHQRAFLICLVFALGLICFMQGNKNYLIRDNKALKCQIVVLEKRLQLNQSAFLKLVDKIYSENGAKKYDSRKK